VAPWSVDLPHTELLNAGINRLNADFSTTARYGTGGSYAVGTYYAVTDHFELGGQFAQSLSRDVEHLANSNGSTTKEPALDIFSLTFGARVHALSPDHRLRPWLIGEAGWYRASAEVDEIPTRGSCIPHCPIFSFFGLHHSGGPDDGFGFNVGAGFDVAVTRWLSIGPDVRYHRAVNVLGNLEFITTTANAALHF
jgi:hypothetical protein